MRLQSKKPVQVKNRVIGGEAPLVCLPVVAADKADLIRQAEALIRLNPDLLEWRIDGYGPVTDIETCIDSLKALRKTMGPIPLILTCRIDLEGGLQRIPRQCRLELIVACIETGIPDIIDIELCNDDDFIRSIVDAAGRYGVKVILSSHNFEATPKEDELLDILVRAQDSGADIAKIAVTPQNYHDVLVLMGATLRARQGKVGIPLVTIAMGEQGVVSRIAGGIFGSDITFAIGQTASAPGQLPIEKMRQAMSVLYR